MNSSCKRRAVLRPLPSQPSLIRFLLIAELAWHRAPVVPALVVALADREATNAIAGGAVEAVGVGLTVPGAVDADVAVGAGGAVGVVGAGLGADLAAGTRRDGELALELALVVVLAELADLLAGAAREGEGGEEEGEDASEGDAHGRTIGGLGGRSQGACAFGGGRSS